MPPKAHQKTQSMDINQLIQNFQQRSPQQKQTELTQQQQQIISSLLPKKPKPEDITKLLKGLMSPKTKVVGGKSKEQGGGQSKQLTHVKTQPNSHQNSQAKLHTKHLSINEQQAVKKLSHPLSTKNLSSKHTQQKQLFPTDAQKSLNIILQYRGQKKRYCIDVSGNKIKWLVDFFRSQLDSSARVVGFRSLFGSVPLDYVLSLHELPLQILASFPTQPIVLEPLVHLHDKTLAGPKQGLKDYDFIKCIGMGGFSKVYLVREKATGSFYAMKLIEKASIVDSNKQMIIQNERDIMIHLNHPFIVKLHTAFESQSYLIFVLEYCSGGELFYLLRKVKKMTEQEAFFYFCEICLGMKHLHDNNIVYRDIKPENILVDFDGHVRIADFGLSKPNMDHADVAYSFCGSPEYMAPEMLLKEGHSFQLDLYCLGALLYELVTGLPPFYSRNTDEIYDRIINQRLTFPASLQLSPALKDLLSSMLAKNQKRRIDSIENVLKHPWMMQWGERRLIEEIERKHVSPPFVPEVFCYNFDEEEFGRGESEFLREMAEQQNSIKENFPQELLLPGFYYQKNEHARSMKFESTGGTLLQLNLVGSLENSQTEYRQQLSQRSQQKSRNQVSRLNTVNDYMCQSVQHKTGQKSIQLLDQLRLYTDQDRKKLGKRKSQQL